MSNLVEQPSQEFKPTYLYIKQHSITGKLYFGKTVQDPEKYKGSGVRWKHHIKKYGVEHVATLWTELFNNKESIQEFAISFSREMNIVESDSWLNLMEEDGINSGSIKGRIVSIETREKMSLAAKGKTKTKEHCKNLSNANIGKVLSTDVKKKIGNSSRHLVSVIDLHTNRTYSVTKDEYKQFKGIKFQHVTVGTNISEDTKEKIREKAIGNVTCRDLTTGLFVKIPKSEFDHLKGIRYVGCSFKNYQNLLII